MTVLSTSVGYRPTPESISKCQTRSSLPQMKPASRASLGWLLRKSASTLPILISPRFAYGIVTEEETQRPSNAREGGMMKRYARQRRRFAAHMIAMDIGALASLRLL